MSRTVLTFMYYYLPGYKAGGPTQTIANMTNAIGDQYEFRIVTMDRDLGDDKPYPTVKYGCWNKVGNALVRYLSPKEQTIRNYKNIIENTDFDLVYFQSFFCAPFTIFPLLALVFTKKRSVPVLIAPRGEFSAGALTLSPNKKRLYFAFFKLFLLKRLHLNFHCSTAQEREECFQHFGKGINAFVALNFSSQEHVNASDISKSGSSCIRCVYLGRINPKKNIDYAIKIIKDINADLVFDYYGSVDYPHYFDECIQLAKNGNARVSINYCNILPHNDVITVLSYYDLFFFPTKNENFGHTIHEALRAGLPVLCSDQTPWHELESRHAGWEVPLDRPDLFKEKIEQFIAMSPEERYQMRLAALQYGIDVSNDRQTHYDNVKMFDALLGTDAKTEEEK